MSSIISGHGNSHGSGTSGGASSIVGVGGALSFMGCVREASPSPHDHRHTHVMENFGVGHPDNTLVKEQKKRRFHPLRGLRRIFRRKSRSAADTRENSRVGERDNDLMTNNREELTMRHPAGRTEEIRSKSAGELLTDSGGRQSVVLRRSGMQEPFSKLRGASGQLSVSHDSIFPGEVPHTRPLSSLDALISLEKRQGNVSDETMRNDCSLHGYYNHRISLGVLEQIKTAIENRHHTTSAESSDALHECYQQETTENHFMQDRMKEMSKGEKKEDRELRWKTTSTFHQDAAIDEMAELSRPDLPKFDGPSLNHTAAHHRISVRPKNRRPPRRTTTSTMINNSEAISSANIITKCETTDTLDNLEFVINNNASSTSTESISVNCKSSSNQLSRTCDISDELVTNLPKIPVSVGSLSPDSLDSSFNAKIIMDNGETQNDRNEINHLTREPSKRISKNTRDELYILETKISKKQSTILNKYVKSSDNLVRSFSKSSEAFNKLNENKEANPRFSKFQNCISKSIDGFDKLSEQLEVVPIPRRPSSKSTGAFDSLDESRDIVTRATQHHLNQHTNITHIVSKSSDSLEVTDTPLISDDSIEQRRSSFEIQPGRNINVMSISSENFDTLEKSQQFEKRSSITDVHLSSIMRTPTIINKVISKSTESFDTKITNLSEKNHTNTSSMDKYYWRISRRTISSESSDNLVLGNSVENKEVRKVSKKIHRPNMVDVWCEDSNHEDCKSIAVMKKPSRYQKSSESSELSSTDTLDSEKRNKLFDSTETIDSLEKELENDEKSQQYYENDSKLTTIESESDACNANNTNNTNNTNNENKDSSMVNDTASFINTDKSYWRQRSDSKENIDIHQILAITIVSRMTANTNNERNSLSFPRKSLVSSPTPPNVQEEGNTLLFNNVLVNKNDEEIQNMLNGNISEVSTDTKSFKEKLIMFEKLGK